MVKNTKKIENVSVDKDFIITLSHAVDDLKDRVVNLESIKELEKELQTLAPSIPKMTRILSTPQVDIEVDFPNSYTMEHIKEKGYLFHKELEILLEKYEVRSMTLKYKREIR